MATMINVRDYFGYLRENGTVDNARFAAEWRTMSDADKDQLKGGLEDGSLTY